VTRAVAERATITRLGAGVDATRRLSPDAVARTLSCLSVYADVVRTVGVDQVAVIATSAMRDAEGGGEIVDGIRSRFGVDVRVLSGAEEARLTFRGAVAGLAIDPEVDLAVFDIGGGSTEVVVGRVGAETRTSFARSFDIGSVRFTERYGEDRAAIASAAKAALGRLPDVPPASAPVGVAGTMTTLAAVSLGLSPYSGAAVHGHTLSRGALAAVVDRLAATAPAARQTLPGLDPGRADVIVAGGTIALALLDAWGADRVRVSDGGVRWGLAEEILSRPAGA
jgi:exopolyphosphatase/guanosine-5'-triphosphate,3'-diphosphate pyrophosphatase